MSKMTAVQWLVEQINPYGVSVHQDLFEQALQMEREQIVEAYYEGKEYGFKEQGEQYYNETYGGQDEN